MSLGPVHSDKKGENLQSQLKSFGDISTIIGHQFEEKRTSYNFSKVLSGLQNY